LRVTEEEKVPTIKKTLGARVFNKEVLKKMQKPWIMEPPYAIRNETMDLDLARYRKDGKIFGIKKNQNEEQDKNALSSI